MCVGRGRTSVRRRSPAKYRRCAAASTRRRGRRHPARNCYTDEDRALGKPLPFDHARAAKLYQALFGQIEDLIKGKQLLLVPSGALTQLPFQVLVTAPPAGERAPAAWLIRDHVLTVLPAFPR